MSAGLPTTPALAIEPERRRCPDSWNRCSSTSSESSSAASRLTTSSTAEPLAQCGSASHRPFRIAWDVARADQRRSPRARRRGAAAHRPADPGTLVALGGPGRRVRRQQPEHPRREPHELPRPPRTPDAGRARARVRGELPRRQGSRGARQSPGVRGRPDARPRPDARSLPWVGDRAAARRDVAGVPRRRPAAGALDVGAGGKPALPLRSRAGRSRSFCARTPRSPLSAWASGT